MKRLKYLKVIKWGGFLCITIFTFILLWVFVTEYREQKILRVTFDNSDYFKPLSSESLPEKNTIVLFGDSRIKQWNPLPEIEGVNIFNRGISEETTAQMMLRFKKDVLDIKPNIVIIQAGINDLVAASVADYNLKNKIYNRSISNIREIIDQAANQGIVVVLLKIVEPYELGLLRSILWGNDLTSLVRQANEDLLMFSDKPNVYVFDANRVLQKNQEGQWVSGVNRDALHFTKKAYQLLNEEIVGLITTLPK